MVGTQGPRLLHSPSRMADEAERDMGHGMVGTQGPRLIHSPSRMADEADRDRGTGW